ncbi:TPA: hypothetical protein HA235_02020 [Candidatus Woesearchaeota archaeon]|nr:hypothetical protein [Candidatus Woesearchaeota archaeon]HIH31460.1 hypothetical protein [Candidatus Woesearchaeota archaeon]HIH54234.1 hypothetical protein [Candidatus Woesearchaeota archaeon]HIJ02629.1 hypothetical protein [Candidatus Woesearchaeota archaeon]HIJ14559.1 hypothetical protein [Candidatus Woesearchaeota archaeon]
MNDFVKMLDKLSEGEIEQFEKDLKEGYIMRYIERKKEFFKVKDKVCVTCGNNVKDDCFVLIFGEPAIRKKAHFCGTDCLQYFFNKKLRKKHAA